MSAADEVRRKPAVAAAWRALVAFTLAVVASDADQRPPEVAQIAATGRDSAGPMAA